MFDKVFRTFDRMEADLNGDTWKRTGPSKLNDQNISDFDLATRARKPLRNKEDIWAELKSRNPVRVNRLQRDYRWVQKQMKKMGLNPEDARELL